MIAGPLVSVLIVTYNASSTIENCLLSLGAQEFQDWEAILVDNASRDDTLAKIESVRAELNFSLKVIALEHNLGFAGGNNRAYAESFPGRYIALLNPDAFAEPAWLGTMVRAMEFDPELGAVASRMIVHGTELIDTAGDGISMLLKCYKRGEGDNAFGGEYDNETDVFGACAGAALYRRAAIIEVGFFDDDFFLLHEDSDLNFRLRLGGWHVRYLPGAVVYHKVSSSIGYMSPLNCYYTLRNVEYVRIKNAPVGMIVRCLPAICSGFIAEIWFFCIKYRMPLVFIKAKLAVIRALPSLLKKRREVQGLLKVSVAELMGEVTPLFGKGFIGRKLKKLF